MPTPVKVALPRAAIASRARVSNPPHSLEAGQAVLDTQLNLINQSIKTLRTAHPTKAIRALSRHHGVFSTAVFSYTQLAMSGYKVTGYSAGTNEFNAEATRVAQSLMSSLDTLYDYQQGYADKQAFDGLLETLIGEVVQTGACAIELVLDRFRFPISLEPVDVATLQWKIKKGKKKYPVQLPVSGGNEIPLDLPTFFYASSQQPSHTALPRSPMEPALQTVYVFWEFIEDLYKILKKAGHPRIVVTLLLKEIISTAPQDIADDDKKLTQYLERVRKNVEDVVSSLEPNEALVLFDTAKAEILKAAGEKADYTSLLDSMSGSFATSLKTMPSVLGMRLGGAQSLSNTESLVYLKLVKAMQTPVETVISRALTLAMRLATGTDAYIKLKFNPVELRPEGELSAHRSVDMQNTLRKLSIGHLSDDEASHQLGTFPRPAGAPNLSGTLFMQTSEALVNPKDLSDNTGATERTLSEGTSKGSSTSSGGGADK